MSKREDRMEISALLRERSKIQRERLSQIGSPKKARTSDKETWVFMSDNGKLVVTTSEIQAAATSKYMKLIDHIIPGDDELPDPGDEMISIILPSRNRPQNVQRLWGSLND